MGLSHTMLGQATGHFLKIISPETNMPQLKLTLVMAADIENDLFLCCDPWIIVQREALPFCPAVTSTPHSQAQFIPRTPCWSQLYYCLPHPPMPPNPAVTPYSCPPIVQMVTKTNAHMLPQGNTGLWLLADRLEKPCIAGGKDGTAKW